MRKLMVIAALVVAVSIPQVSPASGAVAKYRSCTAMWRDFPTGVAHATEWANRAYAAVWQRPQVKRAVYQANLRFDVDRNGVACEKRPIAAAPSAVVDLSVTPLTYTSSTPGLSVSWSPPARTWPIPITHEIFVNGALAKSDSRAPTPGGRYSFAIDDLQPSTTYTVAVVERNAAGSGPPVSANATTKSQAATEGKVTIVYAITGSAPTVNITMQNATGGTSQYADVANPTYTFTAFPSRFVYISAQNQGSAGTVTCTITSEGRVVATSTSSGAYVIATCSGTS